MTPTKPSCPFCRSDRYGAKCPCASRLATAHPDLQRVVRRVALERAIRVLVGHRNEVDQHAAYVHKFSRVDWPNSPHNRRPAMAVDIAPMPIDWKDVAAFAAMGEAMLAAAEELGVELRWGRDFKGLADWPHFELAGWASLP